LLHFTTAEHAATHFNVVVLSRQQRPATHPSSPNGRRPNGSEREDGSGLATLI
jgi:hypothetical protein